jgi:hypothetical protein
MFILKIKYSVGKILVLKDFFQKETRNIPRFNLYYTIQKGGMMLELQKDKSQAEMVCCAVLHEKTWKIANKKVFGIIDFHRKCHDFLGHLLCEVQTKWTWWVSKDADFFFISKILTYPSTKMPHKKSFFKYTCGFNTFPVTVRRI